MVKADKSTPENDAEPGKTGPGLIVIAGAALAAAGAAGSASYFLTPGPAPTAVHADDETLDPSGGHEATTKVDAHQAVDGKASPHPPKKDKHGKDQGGGVEDPSASGGRIEYLGESALFLLDPLIVSIRPIGRSRHLKVSIAIETGPDDAPILAGKAMHLRDILNTYLRAVETETFEDPAAMERLRLQLSRRIQMIAPEVKINGVLITEFILT